MRDGSCREVTVAHPRGTGGRPLTNADVVRKYRALNAPLLEPGRQQAIEAAVLGLAGLADLSALVDLLTPAVPPAAS